MRIYVRTTNIIRFLALNHILVYTPYIMNFENYKISHSDDIIFQYMKWIFSSLTRKIINTQAGFAQTSFRSK
jgi:hypothetical protein